MIRAKADKINTVISANEESVVLNEKAQDSLMEIFNQTTNGNRITLGYD